MFDQEPENTLEESRSGRATAHRSERTGGVLFACEPLEGSGFESELPEDEFEWREQQ
jgi:hypothetical protein